MRQSMRLGRVAGIPVGAHWTVAVILVIITWMLDVTVLPAETPHQPALVYAAVAAGTALLFAGSLLAHELAHALVAKRYGVRVRSITLWMFGGVSELGGNPPSPGADLRIAIAGPATSLALAGIFAGLTAAAGSGAIPAALGWLAVMNGLLAVFNMLPGAPLDGGRVLRAALWRRNGDRNQAGLTAARAGRVTGALIAATGLADLLATASPGGLWLILIGLFLLSAADAETRAAQAMSMLAGLRVRDVMTPDPVTAPAGVGVAMFTAVAARCRQEAFPVIDSGGALLGLVFSDLLVRVPPDDRQMLTVGQITAAVPAEYLAAPEDPAESLLTRPPLRGLVAAIVLEHSQLLGLVTTADLRETIRRHSCGHTRTPGQRMPATGLPDAASASIPE